MSTRNYYILCLVLFLTFLTGNSYAQTQSEKLTVSVKVTNFSNSSVSFSWSNFSVDKTAIYRKKISDNTWTLLQQNINGTTYTDNTISSNVEYEYKFHVTTNNTSVPEAFGYIAFGAQVALKNDRGTILLMVDDRFTSSLETELTYLQLDLISDGYDPIMVAVNKDSSVSYVKNKIDSLESAVGLDQIYLIGHIPVPYAGIIFPDGHYDHRGAWPADYYYATDATNWTDANVNFTNTSRAVNSNTSNDGKYDQSEIMDASFASISRIDFYNLTSAANNEETMLKNYLYKASEYKKGLLEADDAGLIDDKLNTYSEGFARNGYMNFSSLFGDSITTGDLVTNLENRTHKWAYSCSFGSDTSLINTATPSTLRNSSYQGVFSMVFGSYFGDWNTENNFMRSLLADGKMLTTCWAGRPHWFFHHMGLNNPIGLSSKLSVENSSNSVYLNNTTDYDVAGNSANSVHMALLGDLTLRQNYNKAITNFEATYDNVDQEIDLTWDTPVDEYVNAIEIYEASTVLGPYTLLSTVSAGSTTYTDQTVQGENYYYIRYTTLDTTLSGSYYNNSIGSYIELDTTASTNSSPLPVELVSFEAEEVNNEGELTWVSASEENFSHYEIEKSTDMTNWTTIGSVSGSSNPYQINHYQFTDRELTSGVTYYRLKMVDLDATYEYSNIETISTSRNRLNVYPNPTTDNTITVTTERRFRNIKIEDIEVLDQNGRSVGFQFNGTTGRLIIDAQQGIYILKVMDESRRIILL